jgi:hypothetical protein
MIPPQLLDQIKEDPFLAYMHPRALQFDKYLTDTSGISIFIKGIKYDPTAATCEPIAIDEDIGYNHRWTTKYDHRVLWKLYNLKYYYECNPDKMPKYSMMMSSTGSHASPRTPNKRGLTHMQFMGKFHAAHRLQKKMVQLYIGKQDYLSILEGHPTSGYVHSHDLYFLNEQPTDATLHAIENHWNHTQGMGSDERGIKIVVKEPQDFKELQSLIAYPMAYIGKTTIGNLPEWNKYDVVFNTCLWLSPFPKLQGGIGTRIRAFQPSRSLSSVMNRVHYDAPETSYTHIETSIKTPDSYDPQITYKAPNYEMNMQVWHNLTGEE